MKLKVTIFLSLFVALNVLLNPFLSAAGSKATQKKNNGNKVPPRFSPGPSSSAMVVGSSPGPTAFIALINATVSPANSLKSVQFTITPAPGSVTRPISATYTANYLQSRNYLNTGTGAAIIPVFGLYANFSNTVVLNFSFTDGSSQQNMVTVVTADWTDNCNIYKNPTVIQARTASTTLSYDYMLLKTQCGSQSPVILDTDGVVRWIGPGGFSSFASIFFANGIYISSIPSGSTTPTGISRIEFDGIFTFVHDYSNIGVTSTGHHNIDPGRQGMLVEVNTTSETESVILEIDTSGNVLNTWNFANIISAAMTAGGDDPTKFVGTSSQDWFHNNATTYRKSDNTFIASSRENFVIAVDYDTQQIKWILGDPTKHWHQFPSLVAFALTLAPNSLPPIGQHAVSITSNDDLLLFDDGFQSIFQMPAGTSHNPSLARKYQLDLGAMTATEVWNYNQNLFSNVCSSVYEEPGLDYLIDWAHLVISGNQAAELVGLDNGATKVFDYRFPTTSCNTAWNSIPIHLEQMTFTSVIPLRAVSRLTHGSAGTYDVSLPLTGTPAIECRSGGAAGNYQVVVTFATTPVSVTSASVTSDSGGTASVSGAPAISGKDVAVNLTGVSNAQTLTVNLLGVSDGTNTDDVSVRVSILQGDTTGNGIVNSSDIVQVQSQSGQPVTGANFREDVTASGQINSSDINFAQSMSGTALP